MKEPNRMQLSCGQVASEEWDELAHRSGNLFGTREWVSTWCRHIPPKGRLETLISRGNDGKLAAILHLAETHVLPRVLRPIGPRPAPAAPVTCAEEDQSWVVADLARQLAAMKRWQVLLLEGVPLEQAWRDQLHVVKVVHEPNWVIDFVGRTWRELLEDSRATVRRDLLRRERRLRERYEVRLRRTDSPETVYSDIEIFLKLHRMRWGDDSNLREVGRTAFLHDFAAQSLERGWLALFFLDLNGRTVAANLDFRFAGREIGFRSGMDPTYRADHVGAALTFLVIREAVEAGMKEFHFLPGTQGIKNRLPAIDRPVQDLSISRSLVGTAALAMLEAKQQLVADTVRRRLKKHHAAPDSA